MIEKVINIEVIIRLQLSSKIEKIDSKYLKSYKLVKKSKTSQDHWDEDKNKST